MSLLQTPKDGEPVQWAQLASGNSSSGGAGSSSGSSTGPGPQAFNSLAARPAQPTLVTRLDCPEALSIPILLTAAIFEPPR
jgi:hypothetical protein